MEAHWAVLEALESLGSGMAGLGGVLGGAGTAVEAYKRRLGGAQGPLGAVLRPLEAMLEPPGGQKAPKMEPGKVPNRGPEATRTKNANSSKTIVFSMDFNDFSCLEAPFWS